ncbi:MAG: hypothetical protein V1774_07735 [Candidatus Eisenbacteria bacterium]
MHGTAILHPARGGRTRRGIAILLLLLLAGHATSAGAAEPLIVVLKNTLLGTATGLILGATLTLVVDEDSRSEVVRWSAVLGTFGGFGLGLWLASRGDEDLFGRSRPAMAGAASGYAALLWNRKDLSTISAGQPTRAITPGDEARPAGLRFVLLRIAG